MKNILPPIILIFCLISCKSSSQKYEISNSISISVPHKLELRIDDSVFNELMDDLREEYNPNHVIKIGKSKLIFQPKGTDNLEESSTNDVTRILVAHIKIDSNSFPKWDFNFSNQELDEISEYFKEELIRELKALPFENDIIDWNPFKMGSINGLSYVKGSYISVVEGEKSYTETYQFFNFNEKVFITNTTNLSNKDKWIDTFDSVVKTFDFKLRK